MKTHSIILFITIAVLGSSCTAYYAARQKKKDEKLFVKALSNPRVTQRVAAAWNYMNPITQKTVYIKGKDSVIIDSIPYDRVKDSIIRIDCPTVNFDSLKKVWTKIIYHNSVDTLVVADTTCERRLNSTLYNYSILQGKYDQQTTQLTQEQKKSSKWFWLFMAAVFVFVISWGSFALVKAKSKGL